ncbi:Vegetative incompatibility protein HET-E-1 [Ceratocystis fimbriata CBS 114723]|uniref:Vegetative incompatibility protein HET-E-1 n=1 Tax=Ceratocystis fimbriata CBS 114723 TaxID=1035309 RepID=A0A2C5XF04_9PEZI|nr:Vegetative incompatibility protein HET-E-1 [Ceratocystis fimbriata CBS 114723]
MDSSTPQSTGQPVWLLSLDGGGVCGLSSLLILENIMECIQKSERLSEVPRPCDRFDLIGGTGTGGIIAIMLGRLKMSIDQSIKEYKSLASEIFVPEPTPSSTIPASAFSATRLEAAIKRMIRNNCTDPNCLQRKSDGDMTSTDTTCPHGDMPLADENCTKTAVLAMTKDNIETLPTLFKTYYVPGCLTGCRVWEVARATSAAVTLFDPIKLGRDKIEFINASYGHNNPCETLISEAEMQFPGRHMTILSIGTGVNDVVQINDSRSSVLEAHGKMATSSKQADLRLKQKYKSPGVYYRFNVESGLKDNENLDHRMLGSISAHTMNYFNENDQTIEQFATTFTRSGVSQPKAQHDENDKKCLSDLCITDPSTDKKEIESRKGGLLRESYRWILSHENFQQFRKESQSPMLWIKGGPGKGKTMLVCGIIDELQRTNPTSLSYFFCQATNDRVNTATSVLRGLIYRLARQNPHLTKHVRDKYDYNQNLFTSPGAWYELCEILTSMLIDPSLKNAILIVDALDECSTGQKDLLQFIAKPSPAKWIVSSRNWPEIEQILEKAKQKTKIHLEINQDSVSEAVDSYIKVKMDELAEEKNYKSEMKLAVLEHLRLNANGTFLWVSLVCQELSNCQKRHAPNKLTSFPPGLDALYERMVQQILDSDDAQSCKNIIAQVFVAYRPLTLEELCVLVESLGGVEKQERLASGSWDKTVKIWDATSGACLHTLEGHKEHVTSVVFSKDGQRLASGSWDKTVKIWDATSGACLHTLEGHTWYVTLVVFSKDGQRLASGSRDSTVKIWDATSGACLQTLEGHTWYVTSVVFSKDGQRLASGSYKTVKIWDATSGACLHTLEGHHQEVTSVVFSKDGQRLASGSWDKTVKIWDATSGACLHTLEGHKEHVTSVVFSKDGQRLASGSEDKTVKIWDATSGACLQTLEGHQDYVTSVVFSKDGQRLASGSRDSTVKIWDATSGACLQTLEGHHREVTSAVFSPSAQPPVSPPFVDQTSSCSSELDNYCFSRDGVWVLREQKRVLWLPPSYRPVKSAIAPQAVGLSTSSGRIIVMRFRSIG